MTTRIEEIRGGKIAETGEQLPDAAFIIHARNFIPYLLSEIERLEKENEETTKNKGSMETIFLQCPNCKDQIDCTANVFKIVQRLEKEKEMLLRVAKAAYNFKTIISLLLINDEGHVRSSWDKDCWTKIGRDPPFLKEWVTLQRELRSCLDAGLLKEGDE